MKRLTIYLFIFVTGISCTSAKTEGSSEISESLKNHLKQLQGDSFKITNCRVYVVIPGAGCTGCITEVENFLQNNYNKNDSVKYILTSIKSQKLLRTKLGLNLTSGNIILDTANLFSKGDFNSIYPTFYFMNDKGNVESVRHSSPDDDGLAELALRFYNE